MANILYGVNGEGSGHSSRAREVIAYLEEVGHRVHVASFDRGYGNLKDDFDVTRDRRAALSLRREPSPLSQDCPEQPAPSAQDRADGPRPGEEGSRLATGSRDHGL